MSVFFNHLRRGGKAFIDSLLPRLNSENTNGVLSLPFVLEVTFNVTKPCTVVHHNLTDLKAYNFVYLSL